MDFDSRLQRAIPGGAHTYSKGSDQFPANAPQILERGQGVYVFDSNGKKYLDFGMGIRSVLIGYAEEEIDNKAIEYLRRGMNLTRPSLIELEAAELMIELVDSAEMVKFAKNGSTAVTAAVKLARAYTGRNIVAVCADHPFFSYDDWFIGATMMSKGIPSDVKKSTLMFKYNDINSLEELISGHPGEIACVVLEPLATDCPWISDEEKKCCSKVSCQRIGAGARNYLQQVQELCKKNGIVFILDEMITGFRWGTGGAQKNFQVTPDLSTFGKAMANGYPLACLVGKREIMSQGSINNLGSERLFLISTTHGADMASLGAFVANVELITKKPVLENIWKSGFDLMQLMKKKAAEAGLSEYFDVVGPACSPRYVTYDGTKSNSLEFRTLFIQEMLKHEILMPWISIAYRHKDIDFSQLEFALSSTFNVYSKALETDPRKFVQGDFIKPVFRKFN